MGDKRTPSMRIPTLKELKLLIKEENLNSGGRLNSLGLPRDLTLGGTKKKVFTPNLNVVRNKDRLKATPEPKAVRAKKRGPPKDGANSRSKRPKLLQTEGVFSEGMGEIKRRTHRYEKGAGTSKAADSAPLTIPKLNKIGVIDKKKEAEIIAALKHEFSSASESEDDTNIILDLKWDPNKIIWPKNKFKPPLTKNEIKQESDSSSIKCEIKLEPGSSENLIMHNGTSTGSDSPSTSMSFTSDSLPNKDEKPKLIINTNPISLIQNGEIYSEENPAFSLIRFPNSFPRQAWEKDGSEQKIDFTLGHFPEGDLGTVTIKRSGKMEIKIDSTPFVMIPQISEDRNESVVLFPGPESIAMEPSVVALGHIEEKYTLTPEWNSLFERAKKALPLPLLP